jgi:peptidoglycan/xylan/chitin deacetylase (PgdA/CDA1 family)
MISQAVKRRLEAALVRARGPREDPHPRLVALSYHSVDRSSVFASAGPDLFRRHLDWLKEHCEVVPFSHVRRYLGNFPSGRPVVSLTFDDGYADNYGNAFPALAEMGVPATFFLTTGLVERERSVIDRFGALWRVPAEAVQGLTWSQILEMRAAGMEFGAHTRTHRNLAAARPAAAFAEMTGSRSILEDRLQEPVRTFAYPFGNARQHFSRLTMGLAASTGFELAAAVQYRGIEPTDHPLNIPRFPVTGDSLQVLRAKILGELDPLGRFRERAPRWAIRLTSTESPRRLRSYERELRG